MPNQSAHMDGYFNLLGQSPQSPKMREVLDLIDQVGPSPSSVLIVGESGTGKELVVKAIHARSPRSERPLIVINCSALPETLLESSLFGCVKGAFTGAYADKKGLFEEADRGTIFLDEIGEISPVVQVKLLRVLQERAITRVGGSEKIKIDVRILSATNKDIDRLVREGQFREDLFYRLNVITISLPPLRERREDIPILADYFLRKFSEIGDKEVRRISLDAMQTLLEYRWPGNIRELENVIERAVVLSEGELITARDLPPKLLGEFFYLSEIRSDNEWIHLPYKEAKQKALNLFNRAYISNLLNRTVGNISLASGQAGMDRSNFKKIIKKCHLNLKDFRKKGMVS